MRYIYRTFIGYHKKDESSFESIFCENYFSREDAIKAGVENIKFIIDNCDNLNDFLNKYDYEFYIYITDLERIEFSDLSSRISYIKIHTPEDNSKWYEFFVQTAEEIYEVYDYNGNLVKGVIYPWERNITYKSKFIPKDFKIGELVKKIGYDEIYKVVAVPTNIFQDTIFIVPKDSDYTIEDSEEYASTELVKI